MPLVRVLPREHQTTPARHHATCLVRPIEFVPFQTLNVDADLRSLRERNAAADPLALEVRLDVPEEIRPARLDGVVAAGDGASKPVPKLGHGGGTLHARGRARDARRDVTRAHLHPGRGSSGGLGM